jgi:two-component system sensor histidine kinase KdpD
VDRSTDIEAPAGAGEILVAVGSAPGALDVVRAGKRLADALGQGWEAIYVETPRDAEDGREEAASQALALAARLGARVTSLPAASVSDGLLLHVDRAMVDQLVMGTRGRPRRVFARSGLVETIRRRRPDLPIHLVPVRSEGVRKTSLRPGSGEMADYAFTLLGVLLTLLVALLLNRIAGVEFLSILFLFPVIAAAAWWGTQPALLAAVGSTVVFNFVFVRPEWAFQPFALQSLVMGAVLIVVALYTGILTGSLRGRAALSERSAQENARLASFALELTRVSDWGSTARVICSAVAGLLHVQSVLVREVAGELEVAASHPDGIVLELLDRAVVDWSWRKGQPAGSGTEVLSAANWQFQPLKTSLGTLAVLGLARDDGRDPVPAHRAVLLATLVAQAALSLERLRMEDRLREAASESAGESDAQRRAGPSASSDVESGRSG